MPHQMRSLPFKDGLCGSAIVENVGEALVAEGFTEHDSLVAVRFIKIVEGR